MENISALEVGQRVNRYFETQTVFIPKNDNYLDLDVTAISSEVSANIIVAWAEKISIKGYSKMRTMIHDRVEGARNGTNDTVVCRVKSGWVVVGDVQFLKGYCLLLPDPVVPSLNDLTAEQRVDYLQEMSLIGDALLDITDCYRVNYEILGNGEPALHAHIFPRFNSEDPEKRVYPA